LMIPECRIEASSVRTKCPTRSCRLLRALPCAFIAASRAVLLLRGGRCIATRRVQEGIEKESEHISRELKRVTASISGNALKQFIIQYVVLICLQRKAITMADGGLLFLLQKC
jgi:hypothetical protein